MKHYLNDLLCAAAPENGFGQDAIEFAIVTDLIKLRYHLETDLCHILAQYDEIVSAYHRHLNQSEIAA